MTSHLAGCGQGVTAMDKEKKARFEAQGWRVGSIEEFLGLPNVFRDLGFDEDEAERLRIHSTLMIAVRKLIEDRSLTQEEAAKLFGVTQRRISNLVRGRIDLFSIDTLVDMLARAGVHIDIASPCAPAHTY
jgi:predicted XRE-type DNA-binding protein